MINRKYFYYFLFHVYSILNFEIDSTKCLVQDVFLYVNKFKKNLFNIFYFYFFLRIFMVARKNLDTEIVNIETANHEIVNR